MRKTTIYDHEADSVQEALVFITLMNLLKSSKSVCQERAIQKKHLSLLRQ